MIKAVLNNALSTELNRSVGPRFFLPLSGPWRDLAVDLLNHIAPAFSRGRRSLPRIEVLALIEELIVDHPAVSLPEEAASSAKEWNSPNYRANYYLNQLIEAGWILEDEFRHNLRRMTVSLDSNAHALLALLHDMSSSTFSRTARFSDTFRSVINAVLDEQRPVFGEHDAQPYATLKDMIDRCSKGMVVLRRIENIFRRITREQTETLSRRRNLELVVDELQQLTRTQYYQELNNPQLFAQCDQAVGRLEDIEFGPDFIRRMTAECITRGETTDELVAELRVREQLRELSDLLAGMRGEAAQIERWASRFLAASLAKFRHLQAIPSRQIEAARTRLEAIAVSLAGKKWWQDLPVDALPPCRLPAFEFVWGRDSLHASRVPRVTFKPGPVRRTIARLDEAVLAQLLATRRKAITIPRACRFIVSLLPEPGQAIESTQMQLDDLDSMLNVVACLCYASSPKVNFVIERPKRKAGQSRYVPAGMWLLERFTLRRTR